MVKPLASRYHPGARRDWFKVKNIRHQEVVVGGWRPGAGRPVAATAAAAPRHQPVRASVPAQHARGVQWVEPRLVGEIAFSDWTSDLVMRHPSWRALRGDKNAARVRRDRG